MSISISIINLITNIATQQGCQVKNDGRDLTIITENPIKLVAMIVSSGFEREGEEIGKLVAATMVDADLMREGLMYTLSLEITQTRTMPFDELYALIR